MRVTIREVARAARVSVSTASRALAGTRSVDPDLVDRVRCAADELGYRQNTVASALRTQRTNAIGMVVPRISNPFFPALVEAIERCLQSSGRQLLLCDAQEDTAVEAERVLALTDRRVDGLIVVPVSATGSAPILRRAVGHTPVVQVDRHVSGVALDWVGVDDTAGMRLVVEHLVARGARDAVLVSAVPDASTARGRRDGFAHAAARHGLPVRGPMLGTFTVDWGSHSTRTLLASGPLPDAIVCGNDDIALGVLRELRAAGRRVPDTTLVTGFDDTVTAMLSDPPLTTVRQPHARIAAECVRLLDSPRAGAARRVALAPTLVARSSTARRH